MSVKTKRTCNNLSQIRVHAVATIARETSHMSNAIEAAWQAVTDLATDPASRDIRARFAADPARASRWTHRADRSRIPAGPRSTSTPAPKHRCMRRRRRPRKLRTERARRWSP